MVHVRCICQMNIGELYGLNFEATLNQKRHTNAEKLNFVGSFGMGSRQRKELCIKKKSPNY